LKQDKEGAIILNGEYILGAILYPIGKSVPTEEL
jgi:hypothetical protein